MKKKYVSTNYATGNSIKLDKIWKNNFNYFSNHFSSKIKIMASNDLEFLLWDEVIKGAFLIHNEKIKKFKIIERLAPPPSTHIDGDIYIIDKSKDELYGFIINSDTLPYYGIFCRHYEQFICNNSQPCFKTIGDIVNKYDIPYADDILNTIIMKSYFN